MGDTQFNLYTNPRLTDFVKNFQAWFNNPENPVGPNNPGLGGDYKYVSFVPSPEAIHLIDLGRMPFTDLNPVYFSQIQSTQNGNSTNVNTPLGWKMQLGQLYTYLKNQDISSIRSKTISPGLSCQIIQLPINTNFSTPGSQNLGLQTPGTSINVFSDLGIGEISTSKYSFLDYVKRSDVNWVDLFQQGYESNTTNKLPPLYNQISTDVNISTISNYIPLDTKSLFNNSFLGLEWYGYFKAPHIGNYTFTIKCGNDYCLLWLGNKAVCEYIVGNADIQNQNTPLKQNILDDSYVPIRIQYFTSKSGINPRIFTLTITDNDNNQTLSTSDCLFTIDNGNFFPSFVYAAFTSSMIDDFKSGKFKCYSFGGSTGKDNGNGNGNINYNDFYSYMKKNKSDFFKGKYDNDTRLGGNIPEYGTLLNGINYTDGQTPTNPIPNKLSVYRIYSDLRMGRNFQIDIGNVNNGQYMMRELSDDLISLTNDYTVFPDYYPTNDMTATQTDANNCALKCNNSPECNFYYTYSSPDDKPHCVIGTKTLTPVFNQIATDTQSNGSLYLRENKLAKPTVNECISKTTGKDYNKIENTAAYDNTNLYYNYKISDTPLDQIDQIGFCDDPVVKKAIADYSRSQQEAKDILYNYHDYDKGGVYRPSPLTDFQPPNFKLDMKSYYSNLSGSGNIGVTSEGFQNTDAIVDTQYNINNLRILQNSINTNNMNINKNLSDLSQNLIPNYLKTRDLLNSDAKYDYSGNILLYLKDKKIPSKDEQRIIDSSDEYFSQNSLYVLGTITMATLLILAIIIARGD